jgi:hypothetical protein
MADQGINSLLTGFSSSLEKYLGLNIQNNMQMAQEERQNKAKLGQMNYQAELDLKGKTGFEAYKLLQAGKLDIETAKAKYPQHYERAVKFESEHGRPMTLEESKIMFDDLDRAATQNTRQSELREQRMNVFAEKHANRLSKDKIPELLNSYTELYEVFTSGKDVKGVGAADSFIPNLFLGDEGAKNRTNLKQLANTILQSRSGAAVTDQEYKRFLEELQAGTVPTEKAIRTHLGKIGRDMQKIVGQHEAAIPGEALDMYSGRPGAISSKDVKIYDTTKPKTPTLKVGTVQDGFMYLGGDLADQKSWEKI